MNSSFALRLVVVLVGIIASACSNPVGVYRGTTTATATGGGGSSTTTTTGDIVSVFSSADPNSIVIEAGGNAYTATRSGDSLTFQGGQTYSQTQPDSVLNITLTSGTGSLTANNLTVNLILQQSRTGNGQTQNVTVMIAFTGQKI